MILFDAKDISDDWKKLIDNREHKIRLNLRDIVLNKTKVTEFSEEHYGQI